ncbi:hypothetical protein LVJ83_02860 [Uruburuella testudinis]|uniref:Peptidoglycan-synthase activator LpoB n=1 Tax=Uruburuella testudinis TaxID=1282863 RepID=A0ABY4DUZ3_9NEIS|nr:hypothetical protein [Uruburuella testudinis]UOO82432.1 hypothetical protein LVJ83_02860 [Uruburuella testudinis]
MKYQMMAAGIGLMLSSAAFAQNTYYIEPQIPYADANQIAERVVKECTNLGADFSAALLQQGGKQGVGIRQADGKLSDYPDRLEIAIDAARSYGFALIGHYKATHVDVALFRDNVKVAETQLSRSSMGGVLGAFKSSCSVLKRVNNALGKDIVRWVKQQDGRAADAAVGAVPASRGASATD